MAQYYNGQYNLAKLQQGGYQPPIISMYNPEEEMVLSEAMRNKQGRFDASVGAVAQETARIGELETFDPELMKGRLQDFEGKVNDLVSSKYEGDYSAAANDIVGLIAKERNDPFYQYNKQKVEASKTYQEDARRLGANFMSTKNPLEVDYNSWKKGEDFQYTPVDKNQIVATSANIFSSMANTLMNDPALALTEDGQYFKSVMQYGLSDPQAVMDFIQNDPKGQAMVQQIYQSMPELQGLPQQAVMDAITQGAYSAIGQTKVDYQRNYGFDPTGGQGVGGPGLVYQSGYLNANEIMDSPKLKNDFTKKIFEEFINSEEFKELKEAGYDNYNDIQALVRSIDTDTQTNLRPSGTGTRYVPNDSRANNGVTPIVTKAREFKNLVDNRVNDLLGGTGLLNNEDKYNYGLATYALNSLSDPNDITKLNQKINQLNIIPTKIDERDEHVVPMSDLDKKNLNKMTKDKTLQSFSLNPASATPELILVVDGEDDKGNPLESRLHLTDRQRIEHMLIYLYQIDQNNPIVKNIISNFSSLD